MTEEAALQAQIAPDPDKRWGLVLYGFTGAQLQPYETVRHEL